MLASVEGSLYIAGSPISFQIHDKWQVDPGDMLIYITKTRKFVLSCLSSFFTYSQIRVVRTTADASIDRQMLSLIILTQPSCRQVTTERCGIILHGHHTLETIKQFGG